MKKIGGVGLALFFLFSAESQAQSFCFASAGSYYEQIYCEVQARGEAKTLPPFYQFKRNDSVTQALLLKRPAARIGVVLAMPKSTTRLAQASEKKLPASVVKNTVPIQAGAAARQPAPAIASISEICKIKDEQIHCGAQRFQLTGNLRNQRLEANALTADNKMALPVYRGDISNKQTVETYLVEAYRRYIEQMHTIGLGGVTMTYGKFYFLFFDLQEKGLNFSQRFEIMYDFLKKDKASMGISEKLTVDDQLAVKDCDSLTEQVLVCSRAGRNYLYMKMSE